LEITTGLVSGAEGSVALSSAVTSLSANADRISHTALEHTIIIIQIERIYNILYIIWTNKQTSNKQVSE
jgi:hypothetical protein